MCCLCLADEHVCPCFGFAWVVVVGAAVPVTGADGADTVRGVSFAADAAAALAISAFLRSSASSNKPRKQMKVR